MALVRNIVVVVVAFALYKKFLETSRSGSVEIKDKYDYIIVGAGSAGGVLSDRLTEDGQNDVLLIEAGVDDQSEIGDLIHSPVELMPNFKSDLDWEYYTEPQRNSCFAMKNKRSFWPRGKLLGGSSSFNGLMWVRGSRHDYDKWAEHGAEGWSYAEVLPYFIRMEDNKINVPGQLDKQYHGTGGPIKIRQSKENPEIIDAVLKAATEIGHHVLDVNGKDQKEWSASQMNVHKGERQSTARTYIKQARGRRNLDILTHAHVNKIIFKDNMKHLTVIEKTAIGVEYIHYGKLKKVYVNKEVVVSAGAIGSPHVLMLSGIGPRDHLQKLGIPVLVDLPVGENLLDHVFIDIPFLVKDPIAMTPERINSWPSALQYELFGSGLKCTTGVQAAGFSTAQTQPKNDQRPYLQYMLYTGLLGADGDNFKKAGDGLDLSQSSGSIKLKSQNPFEHPSIDPKYLAHDQDVEVLFEGIRTIERMAKTEAFKSVEANLLNVHHPGCKDHKYRSDDYWRCYIRHNTLTVYHPTTTCKMGSKDDPSTVVDSELRVHGTEGLRVVDASVMPDITSGNTNAPTIMIAEKASDIVLGKPALKPIKHL